MSDDQKKKSLSEISHLFLSSVRDNATGGDRPRRLPPGSEREEPAPAKPRDVSIDMTPEEYARVFGNPADPERPPVGPVSAVICPQFNGHQLDRVKEYAKHLAAGGERVGLIQVDATECRVLCFEVSADDTLEDATPTEVTDPRAMAQAMEELAWDVDRWVLLLNNPRLPEARGLLRDVNHWVLLSTCDHDGVVSCYRAIKGLADAQRPRLTLALMNAVDQTEAGKVYRKIAGVCQQFLSWNLESEPAVEPTDTVAEHLALVYRPTRDRNGVGTNPQWTVVSDFLARAQESAADLTADEPETFPVPELEEMIAPPPARPTEPIAPVATRIADFIPPIPAPAVVPPLVIESKLDTEDCEIADLPSGELTESAVLSAVMRRTGSTLVECPIRPPSCPQAALAVGRDRRLILLAVARRGLPELRSIGQAYKWVVENRPLLSMALPQFAIDADAMPGLRLVVDRQDLHADLLLPMTDNSNITVQTYRKLKWAGKTGLLLEAA